MPACPVIDPCVLSAVFVILLDVLVDLSDGHPVFRMGCLASSLGLLHRLYCGVSEVERSISGLVFSNNQALRVDVFA